MWSHLTGVDILCHIGDQIYIDYELYLGNKNNAYSDSLNLLHCDELSMETKRIQIIERIKQEYIATWTHSPTARIMANTPNMMMFDDHDIIDGWGDDIKHWTEGTDEYIIGSCARSVLEMYQIQLHHDISRTSYQSHYFYNQSFEKTNLVFLDVRGCKTFYRDKSGTYLGRKQQDWIENTICCDNSSTNHLILISPIPFIVLSSLFTNNSSFLFRDVIGIWNYDEYIDDLKKLILVLTKWKSSQNGRKITLVGGDVHFGGFTNINFNGEHLMSQLITSPISNTIVSSSKMTILNHFKGYHDNLGEIEYNHSNWYRHRNYGIVNSKGIHLICIKPDGTIEIHNNQDNVNHTTPRIHGNVINIFGINAIGLGTILFIILCLYQIRVSQRLLVKRNIK